MSIISISAISADVEPDLLTRIRESASAQCFSPRGTVRCQGPPIFRNQLARDIACLLDVDPTVVSWTCLPLMLLHPEGMHVPDLAVTYASHVTLVDVLPTSGASPIPAWTPEAARASGHRYEIRRDSDLPEGCLLDNARDLLRYASYRVSLGDRVRLLTLLEEGPMPLATCMQVIHDSRDAIGVIAALVLRRFIGVDLDEGPIGPETRVSRLHD